MNLFKIHHRVIVNPDGLYEPQVKCFPCKWGGWFAEGSMAPKAFTSLKDAQTFIEIRLAKMRPECRAVKVVSFYD